MVRMPGESLISMPGEFSSSLGKDLWDRQTDPCYHLRSSNTGLKSHYDNLVIKPLPIYISNHIPREEFKTNLLGYDARPSGFHHRWGEDEKRIYLFGNKSEAEIDISYLKAQQKRDSEYIPVKFEPPKPPIDLKKIMDNIERENREANTERALSCLKTFEPLEPPTKFNKEITDIIEEMNREANSKLFEYKISEPVINLDVDLAPIVRVTGDETVYKGAGHSHFSFVKDKGYHVTTHLPKMGLRENSFSLRDNIEVMDL